MVLQKMKICAHASLVPDFACSWTALDDRHVLHRLVPAGNAAAAQGGSQPRATGALTSEAWLPHGIPRSFRLSIMMWQTRGRRAKGGGAAGGVVPAAGTALRPAQPSR
ncbi:hypothetical protein ABPG75_003030 [Micractinium tetrahymenae]